MRSACRVVGQDKNKIIALGRRSNCRLLKFWVGGAERGAKKFLVLVGYRKDVQVGFEQLVESKYYCDSSTVLHSSSVQPFFA